ncbi:MAG: hypothetical protein ACI9QL_002791 [Candidatus Omnitrophota bacterium]|jgi:hypothetical protein
MSFQPTIHEPTIFDRLDGLVWTVSGRVRKPIAGALHRAAKVVNGLCVRSSPALIMGLFSAILGNVLVLIGSGGIDAYFTFMSPVVELERLHRSSLVDAGLYARFGVIAPLIVGAGYFLAAMSLLGLLKIRLMHLLHKMGVAAGMLAFAYILYYLVTIPETLLFHNTVDQQIIFDKEAHHSLLIVGVWAWIVCALPLFWYAVTVAHSRTAQYYRREVSPVDPWGDRVTDSVRTGGEDPRFKESTRWSIGWHIFLLFILPLLSFSWMKPYEIPKGSGVQAPQVVKVIKQKKKKQDKMVFNPNSAISFLRVDIDDSNILEEVLVETEAQYEETSSAAGKLGKGGGTKGGWPNGMENARVRFIRLEYAGGNWDQSMGGGADYNFLLKFKELTGFNVARETESIRISDLRKFPKGKGPPFVYLTGGNRRDGFGSLSISSRDTATLRWYVTEEGGMIFADNGGDGFDASFRQVMRRVLPNAAWIDISNDDAIYRQPYLFPDGAPKVQAHSGTRGLGIKNDDGRWVVFYHQGDLKDAWKDGGSGFSKAVQMASYKMGINVVNYAFNQYLSRHYEE